MQALAKPLHILHVGDDATTCPCLSLLARKAPSSWKVRSVELAIEDLQAVEDWPADVLLLDLASHAADGVAAVETLRASRPNTPMVVLSEADVPALAERVQEAGAQSFLSREGLSWTGLSWAIHLAAAGGRPDLRFSVSIEPGHVGKIRPANGAEDAWLASFQGQLCYRALWNKERPCRGCPVYASAERPWPRMGLAWTQGPTATLTMVLAERIDEHTCRVTSHPLDAEDRGTVREARLHEVAACAQLSRRERTVLNLLVAGASYEEVASRLRITQRTVKFHTRSLFGKLGVDSRADLLRVLF